MWGENKAVREDGANPRLGLSSQTFLEVRVPFVTSFDGVHQRRRRFFWQLTCSTFWKRSISWNVAIMPPSICKHCSESRKFQMCVFLCCFLGRGNSFTTMKTTELRPETLQSGWKSKCSHNLLDFWPSFSLAQLHKKVGPENGAKLHSAVSVCQIISEKPPSLTWNVWHRLLAVFITPCLHTPAHLTTLSSVYSCSPSCLIILSHLGISAQFETSAPAIPPPPRLASPASFSSIHFVFPRAWMALQGRETKVAPKGHRAGLWWLSQEPDRAERPEAALAPPPPPFESLLSTSIVCSLMPD